MSNGYFGLDQTDISLNFELFGVVDSQTSIVVSGVILDGAGVTKQFERSLQLDSTVTNQSFILPLFNSKILSFQAIIANGQNVPGRIFAVMRMQSGTTAIGIKSTVLASGFITETIPLYYPGNPSNVHFNTNGNSFMIPFIPNGPGTTASLVVPPFHNLELLTVLVSFNKVLAVVGGGISLSATTNAGQVIGVSFPVTVAGNYSLIFSNTGIVLSQGTNLWSNIPQGITLTNANQLNLAFYNFLPGDSIFSASALFNLSVY